MWNNGIMYISDISVKQCFIILIQFLPLNDFLRYWKMGLMFMLRLLQVLVALLLSWLLEDEYLLCPVFSRSRGNFHFKSPVFSALYTSLLSEICFLKVACVCLNCCCISYSFSCCDKYNIAFCGSELFRLFSFFEYILSTQNLTEHSDSECEEWQSLHSTWCPHLCYWHCSGMFGEKEDEIKNVCMHPQEIKKYYFSIYIICKNI